MTVQMTVAGRCPVCAGEQLELDVWSDRVVCTADGCPRPLAASEILADGELEHMVEFTEAGFTVRHPLRERLDDALVTCQVHEIIARFDGPMFEGRYRMWLVDGRLDGAPVDESDAPAHMGPSRPFPPADPQVWP